MRHILAPSTCCEGRTPAEKQDIQSRWDARKLRRHIAKHVPRRVPSGIYTIEHPPEYYYKKTKRSVARKLEIQSRWDARKLRRRLADDVSLSHSNRVKKM